MGHAEIFECLKREILAGVYDADEVLPSESALARRFGVSRPTVSRSVLDLRRAGLVVTRSGAATRLSKFAINSSGALGIVDPGSRCGGVISEICDHIEQLARRVGWKVLRGVVSGKSPRARATEVKRIIRTFNDERVSGVFMQPLELQEDNVRANEKVVSLFDKADLPIVLLDYDVVRPPARSKFDLVGMDNFRAGYAVGKRLLAGGCRRVGFCMRPGEAPTVMDRMRGVACAVLEAGGAWSHACNVLDFQTGGDEAFLSKVRKLHPDAIACGNDTMAVRVQDVLKTCGSEVRLGGFDALESLRDRHFVTVRQPSRAIAQVAFGTMLTRIKRPDDPPRTVLLPGAVEDWSR